MKERTLVDGTCVPSKPQGFVDADAAPGDALYDGWWVVAGVEEPADGHSFWATQDTNGRSDSEIWCCEECRGWDCKGVDGAYGSGAYICGGASSRQLP